MTGFDLLIYALLFIILAPLATVIGVVLCSYVVLKIIGIYFKDEIKAASEKISEEVARIIKESKN
jgi:hypothetical protein